MSLQIGRVQHGLTDLIAVAHDDRKRLRGVRGRGEGRDGQRKRATARHCSFAEHVECVGESFGEGLSLLGPDGNLNHYPQIGRLDTGAAVDTPEEECGRNVDTQRVEIAEARVNLVAQHPSDLRVPLGRHGVH
jgi:hypothetical protein